MKLTSQLMPSTEGGWVLVEEPVSEDLTIEIQAATLAPMRAAEPYGEISDALATSDGRTLPLATSLALAASPVNGVDQAAVAETVLDLTRTALDTNDLAWIGVLMNLSRQPSPVAEQATAELTTRFGPASCDDIAQARSDHLSPQGGFALAVRKAASRHLICDSSLDLADDLLTDEAWAISPAAPELADLIATIDPSRRAEVSASLADGAAAWPDPGAPIAEPLLVQAARLQLDMDASPPAWVERVAQNQLDNAGGLSDVSTRAPTPLDAVVQDQLVAEGLLDEVVAQDTRQAIAKDPTSVVDTVLLTEQPPSCETTTNTTTPGSKVNMSGLVEAQILRTVDAHCEGLLDVDDLYREAAEQPMNNIHPSMWAAAFTLCLLDPERLGDAQPSRVPSPSAFAGDPVYQYFSAYLSDPEQSCRALTTHRRHTDEEDADEQ